MSGLGQAEATEPRRASAGDDTIVGGISVERLRNLVSRIERLEDERKALSEDITDIYKEGKNSGFDPKVLRQLIRIRKMDASDLEEAETLLDVYRRALDT